LHSAKRGNPAQAAFGPPRAVQFPLLIAGTLEKKQNFFSNHRRKTPAAAAKRPKRLLHSHRRLKIGFCRFSSALTI